MAKKTETEKTKTDAARTVLVEVPIHRAEPGYMPSGIDVRLSRRQACAAKILTLSLIDSKEFYEGGPVPPPVGTPVYNVNNAVKWLFDRLADAIEETTGKVLVQDFDFQS